MFKYPIICCKIRRITSYSTINFYFDGRHLCLYYEDTVVQAGSHGRANLAAMCAGAGNRPHCFTAPLAVTPIYSDAPTTVFLLRLCYVVKAVLNFYCWFDLLGKLNSVFKIFFDTVIFVLCTKVVVHIKLYF
jgi:hypothetical protein